MPERLHHAIDRSHQLDLSLQRLSPRRFSIAASRLSGPVADLFLLDPEQRHFAETALCAERSLGSIKMAFGQVLGTIGAMIPETEAIFEAELLSKQHPDLILEQAREVLMLRSLHALREINTLRASGGRPHRAHSIELEEETRRDALTGRIQPQLSGTISGARIRELDAPQMALERGVRRSGQLQEHQRKLRTPSRRSQSCRRPRAFCAATPARPT